jgi:tRNA-splicing ligase RtcB
MERINEKLLNWASILDPKTRLQAEMTARMPFIYPWLALMPDAHLGKGATVGSVLPTLGAIMPAAVGVDLGCGMIAHRTQFTVDDLRSARTSLAELRIAIEVAIPSSMGHYNSGLYNSSTIARVQELENTPGADQAYELVNNWHLQLGSLGSGNHFIEVTADEEDRIWLFLHSGSRGVGNKLAMKHIEVAQEYTVPGYGKPGKHKLESPDLAYLEEGTPRIRFLHRGASLGTEVRPAEPRGDDGPADPCEFSDWIGARVVSGRADQLPPQLHGEGNSLRQGSVAVPQGCHRRQSWVVPV